MSLCLKTLIVAARGQAGIPREIDRRDFSSSGKN